MINVFVGYDTKEKMAFNVLSYSILKNISKIIKELRNLKDG